jgi:ring-1,2-phenylacetyl-CoA epoxidase subunit PaaD
VNEREPSSVDLLIASDRVPANAHPELLTEDAIWALLDNVKDPEVPAVSVLELGIVRRLSWDGEHLSIDVTPTYSGCPATELIEELIAEALRAVGIRDPHINRVLTPAWSTDWITDVGREKLRVYGIAPPQGSASKMSLLGADEVITCPFCDSKHTERVSEFGSTACKALYRCRDCLEPFDYFKCI